MMKLHQLLATGLGIGYIGKGGGTIAALACCIVWYTTQAGGTNNWVALLITILIVIIGICNGNKVEAAWGKDSSKVVIDEIAGMCITLLFVPVTILNIFNGLVLFRFFDIVKPLFIKKMEQLPGGWGVMMDDVLAGIYANVLLQIIVCVFNT
ncbi:MAG: phosphatidylglycerophosphatase A [Deinococcales bacterium]|nr:phosphatidylglycerophosphatase A [Chitinophagaceae bacterium]